MKNLDYKAIPEILKKFPELIKKYVNKGTVIIAISVLAAITVFVGLTLRTAKEYYRLGRAVDAEIITRMPIHNIWSGWGQPEAAIILPWYENTVYLEEEQAPELSLRSVIYPVTIKDTALEYSVSDPVLAEIDSDGNIKAHEPGSVEFTVANKYTGKQAKAYLQIIQPMRGLFMNKSTINLYTTDMNTRLEAYVQPENASNAVLKWYSKDNGIVEVDKTGHLKPVKTGMTEVVAESADGKFSAKCFVNVINEIIKAQRVDIVNKTENIEIAAGETWTGLASVQPANARNLTVSWSSSNTDVATVTNTGVVKGISAGTAEITAMSADGPSDSVTVNISGSGIGGAINLNPNYDISGGIRYTAYNHSLSDMLRIQMKDSPKYSSGGGFSAASESQVQMYLDPNIYGAGAYKYQFMDLSQPSGISRDALNSFLSGKGVLSNQADAFIEAANTYHVNELYLVAHACIETGNGSSQLARGIMVNGTRVYNVYGINAVDSNPVGGGSQAAYRYGWTSVTEAIKGGAQWISEKYINNPSGRQNTLYKMRWNPDNPGEHMYATDISWAVSQAVIMDRLISQLPNAVVSYEIPVYAGSNAIEIIN